jgi:nucleoside-diphosphate-sugar epimerase
LAIGSTLQDTVLMKKIAIIGLGWLGYPLAQAFTAAGYEVSGTTTSPGKADSFRKEGIYTEVWAFDEGSNTAPKCLASADIAIITLPPRKNYLIWLQALRTVCSGASANALLIYTSSTGVYRNQTTSSFIATEDIEIGESPLAIAEEILKNSGKNYLIFRLAGLAGGGRNPARFLAGKINIKGGLSPVNLVHQTDVVQAIMLSIQADIRNEIFNVCSDEHPLKKDYYPDMAKKYGFPVPQFDVTDQSSGYTVSNIKIKQQTGLCLKYPHPFNFE